MKPSCMWILSAPGVHPQIFCHAPVAYTMQRDRETGRMIRCYAYLCDEHKKAADALPPDDDE